MAVTRTLIAKELRQHGLALGGLSVLLALAWGLGQATQEREARVLSALELVSSFAMLPLVAAALYLGHRLVVAEYFGRTQRFVEALPIRRGHMALVKGVFGLAWMELWAAGALLSGVASASGSEPIDGRFVGILAARLGLYVFALWGVVFLLGFFGRLRIPLGAGVGALLMFVDRYTAWEIGRFGPFALIARDTFGFERQHFPTMALLQAGAVGCIAVAGAWALARVREGSVVEALARPLSPRELSALLVVGTGAIVAVSALQREPEPQPYAFTTSKVLRAERGSVEVAYLEDELRPAAERLVSELEPTLKAFAEALGLPWPLPPVRLVHGPEIPADRPRSIRSHPVQGVVLRVNLEAADARERTRIVALVLHQLIWARTRGRAALEPKHWLLDGFALHFALHGRQPAAPALDEPDEALLRAIAASELMPFGAEVLSAYQLTSERLGDDLASAVSASGWRILEARVGREKILALARAALTRPGTSDVRDFVHDRRNPLPALFRRTTGIEWTAFLQTWADELARLRARPAAGALLASLPRGRFELLAQTGRVGVRAQLPQPLSAATRCTLGQRRLLPYDAPVSADSLEEVGFVWSKGDMKLGFLVDATYGHGERALIVLDCHIAEIGCAARLHAGRVTVP